MIKFIRCPITAPGIWHKDPILDSVYRPLVYDIRIQNPNNQFGLTFAIKQNPLTGIPVKNWALCIVRGDDLSAIDANPDCVDVLDGIDTDVSFKVLKQRLKNKKIGDLTNARRLRLKAIATSCEMDITQFGPENSVWEVLRAIFYVQENDIENESLEALQ